MSLKPVLHTRNPSDIKAYVSDKLTIVSNHEEVPNNVSVRNPTQPLL